MNMNMWVLPDLPFQFTRFAFWVWVYDVSEVLTFSSVVILHFIEFFFASCWSSVFFTLIITWYKCKLANRFAWKRRKPIELYERTQKMQIEFERERERNEKKNDKKWCQNMNYWHLCFICLRLDISIRGFSIRKLSIEIDVCEQNHHNIPIRNSIDSNALKSYDNIWWLQFTHTYQPHISIVARFFERIFFFVILLTLTCIAFFW